MPHPGSIEPRYRDALGRVQRVPDETMRRLQAVLGESAAADDAGRALNEQPVIDRDGNFTLKMRALQARPIRPGTVSEWPNWTQPLPKRLEALARDPQTSAIAAAVASRAGAAASRPTRQRRARRPRKRAASSPPNQDCS